MDSMGDIKTTLKKSLKRVLSHAGYHLVSSKQQGQDVYYDFWTLLGSHIHLILDIGANVGQTALDMSRAFPQATIHSFEPHPPTFEILQRNLAKLPRTTPHNLGFGLQNSEMTMYEAEKTVGNSLLKFSSSIADYGAGSWTKPTGTSTVQIRRLEDWCLENQIDKIDILKIDTQGYELNILRGAERLLRPEIVRSVFLEVSFVPLYEQQTDFVEVYSELVHRGYRLVDFYKKVRQSKGYLKWCDALFI